MPFRAAWHISANFDPLDWVLVYGSSSTWGRNGTRAANVYGGYYTLCTWTIHKSPDPCLSNLGVGRGDGNRDLLCKVIAVPSSHALPTASRSIPPKGSL